jgi:hypothetical protein
MSHVSPEALEPLPDGTRLLHIGPQKTGSTALQYSLHHHRDELREHGVVYPGPGIRSRLALGAGLGYPTPVGGKRPREKMWREFLADVNTPHARVVCISSEGFGRASNDLIARTVEALGGPRPHVLLVARRLDRLLPSQWQQRVKARVALSYDEWLRVVLGPPAWNDQTWRNVWQAHDSARLAGRWAAVVGAENVTVLVSDDSDRALLHSVVERLLGVPRGLLEPDEDLGNRSLTYGELELLRAVNEHFETHGYSDKRYHRLVHRALLPALVMRPSHPDDPPIPPLPSWAWAPLVQRSRKRVDGLARLGVRIVGDPSRLLLPDEPPPDVVDGGTTPPPTQVPIEIAGRALGGLIDGAVQDREMSVQAARQRGARLTAEAGVPDVGRARRGPRRRRPGRPFGRTSGTPG